MHNTALITGASRGIGAAIAHRFARAGYHLTLACHQSSDRLHALARTLADEYGIDVIPFTGDIADPAFVREMCTRTLAHFGHIDVLVNNAGIAHIGLLSDMTYEQWDRILSTNLSAAFGTCSALIPSMVHRQSGRIINISSVWGATGASCEAAYSASKGGLDALTRSLGKELAPSHIAVNAIACGLIDTEMNAALTAEECAALCDAIPAGRMGRPEEVAELALLLAQAPEYLTGQIITLDGGWI